LCALPALQLQKSAHLAANLPKHLADLIARSRADSLEQDLRVLELYDQLIEIEQRLIPTGLHVFGRASELQEKADLLRMVASFDRPEQGARALQRLVADALGVESYDALLHETSTSETRQLIDGVAADAVRQCCEHGVETAV